MISMNLRPSYSSAGGMLLASDAMLKNALLNSNISPLTCFCIVTQDVCFFLLDNYVCATDFCCSTDSGQVLPANEGKQRNACSFLL